MSTGTTWGILSTFDHLTNDWSCFKSRLSQWFIANEITDLTDKSKVKRRAIILSALSESTFKLANDLALPKKIEEVEYDQILKLLDDHCTPKRFGFAEKAAFYSAVQRPGESPTEWAARIRGLAGHCGFKCLEEALVDKFIMGMSPGHERDKLFAQDQRDLTLAKAVDMAESVRSARRAAAGAGPSPDGYAAPAAVGAGEVFAVAKIKCSVCGYTNHKANQCRFKGYKCKKCNRKGHLRRMCPGTEGTVNLVEDGNEGDDGGVWSLRNLSISVPRAVLSGEGQSAVLRCSYDLEGAALYSIRWYRAEIEFYRYVPREMPPTMVFSMPGTSVDLAQSDHQQVRIVNLNRRLSGDYQCEVSADAPLFHTDIRSAPLTVVDTPFRAPRISVSRASYARGDVIRANCSVDESYPASNITWILDEHKIAESVSPQSNQDFKERGAFSRLELTVLEAEHYKVGLTFTSANLNRAYQDHFIYDKEENTDKEVLRYTMVPPPTGQFTLGCVATIFDIYARKSDLITIKEEYPHPESVTREDSSGELPAYNVVLTSVCAGAVLLHTL